MALGWFFELFEMVLEYGRSPVLPNEILNEIGGGEGEGDIKSYVHVRREKVEVVVVV